MGYNPNIDYQSMSRAYLINYLDTETGHHGTNVILKSIVCFIRLWTRSALCQIWFHVDFRIKLRWNFGNNREDYTLYLYVIIVITLLPHTCSKLLYCIEHKSMYWSCLWKLAYDPNSRRLFLLVSAFNSLSLATILIVSLYWDNIYRYYPKLSKYRVCICVNAINKIIEFCL